MISSGAAGLAVFPSALVGSSESEHALSRAVAATTPMIAVGHACWCHVGGACGEAPLRKTSILQW